jgi:hypothetical protein
MRSTPEGLVVRVYVQPGASDTRAAGMHGELPRIRVSAPAVDDKANKHLVGWLAKRLSVGRSDVRVLSGRTSRLKTLAIDGDAAVLQSRLVALLS